MENTSPTPTIQTETNVLPITAQPGRRRSQGPGLESTLCFIGGFAALALTHVPGTMTVAAWLAPLLLLRVSRVLPMVRGAALLALGFGAVAVWNLNRVAPAPLAMTALLGTVEAAIALLPFLADRWAGRRLPGWCSVLVFPTWLAACEWLGRQHGYFGSWGAQAYTQGGQLALMQVGALTGLWGVTFLVGWGASAVNAAWPSRSPEAPTPSNRRPMLVFAVALPIALLAGSLRLAWHRVDGGPTAMVAAIASPESGASFPSANAFRTFGAREGLSAEAVRALRAHRETYYARLFELTRQAANAGARLVAWSEGAAPVLAGDEAALIEQGRAVARAEGIYLVMGLWVHGTSLTGDRWQNKAVLITSRGDVAFSYAKHNLVPGMEAAMTERGTERMAIVDTPELGRIGVAICFDTAFPQFAADAGRHEVDLLVSPAHLWPQIAEMDAVMNSFRAVENGCAVLRPGGNGMSLAADALGRTVALQQTHGKDWSLMLAQVPLRRVTTWFPQSGDAFGWLCAAAAMAMVCGAVSVIHKPRAGAAAQ